MARRQVLHSSKMAGGLVTDSKSRTRGGVPLLTKVPLVGGLFGSTGNNGRRTELIVLITPRVIRSVQESGGAARRPRQLVQGIARTVRREEGIAGAGDASAHRRVGK